MTDLTNRIPNSKFLYFKHHINQLFDKLNTTLLQLDTFEPRRSKRGLINPLGTFIKSITGNLDNEDALRLENALKTLQKDDKEISTNFNKHISIYKNLTLQQTKILEKISDNQKKLEKALSYMQNSSSISNERIILYAQLSQLFSILSENIQDLSLEMIRLENILAFSRTNSMHHSILSINDLVNMLSKLKNLYGSNSILDLDVRYFYNIIRLGTYFVDKKIVIVLKFPIMSPITYNLFKLCPVPNKKFEIILPPFPYIATNSQEFVYMEAECPKVDTWYICKQKVNHQTRTQDDCISKLIRHQEIDETCNPTKVYFTKEALLELDSQHYIISFPRKTKVQIFCEQEEHRLLEGSYLATIPRNCHIKTPEFTAVNIDDKLRGHAVEIMTFPAKSSNSLEISPQYNLTTIDLNELHNIQHQVIMETPTKFESTNFSSMYHTTIPTYVITLLGAAVLIIVLLYIKKQRKFIIPRDIEMGTMNQAASSDFAQRKAATFSLDLGK